MSDTAGDKGGQVDPPWHPELDDLGIAVHPRRGLASPDLQALGRWLQSWMGAAAREGLAVTCDPGDLADLLAGELPTPAAVRFVGAVKEAARRRQAVGEGLDDLDRLVLEAGVAGLIARHPGLRLSLCPS